jgi:hypothetical protein
MRVTRTLWLCFAGCLFASCAHAGGYAVVRITDHMRQSETLIMTSKEYRDLRLAMNSERIQHGKAIKKVLKLWDEQVEDYKCPARELKPRKIKRLHSTTTYERARERLAFMQSLKVSLKKGSASSSNEDQPHLTDYYASRERYKQRDAQRERIHEALMARAYNMFVGVMNELLAERYGELGVSLTEVDEPVLPAKPVSTHPVRNVKRIGESSGYDRFLKRTKPINKHIGN